MSWDKAITFALKWEGGYVNHKNDKGGPTNRGITQAVLTAACVRAGQMSGRAISDQGRGHSDI